MPNLNLYQENPTEIVLYGVNWCGDCRRARLVLKKEGVSYVDVDIDQDPTAAIFVEKINGGFRSVPTIVFPGGTTLTEPDNESLIFTLKKSN